MPFKHNAARRHGIPRARYRVRNWPAYEAGLKRRGDPTPWLDQAAMAGWQAPQRTTPGGQAWYSDVAVEPVLMLRLVFHLAMRQAEGFAASVLRLLGQDLRVPDHTTLSRRGRGFAGRRPAAVPHGPMHLVIDSTGLKRFGRGEWDAEKHCRARRSWRSLYGAFRVKGSSPPLRLERHPGHVWPILRGGERPEGSSPWRCRSSRRELVCEGV
jgi:Transposase DDE domain